MTIPKSHRNADGVTRALSIRQPYVEQIMRGDKRIEYRTMPTRITGRVLLYASLKPGLLKEFKKLDKEPGDLPVGAILGSVEIVKCTGEPGDYKWHLANPRRLKKPLLPKKQPQPAWFFPF
jgi:hypothetical protein